MSSYYDHDNNTSFLMVPRFCRENPSSDFEAVNSTLILRPPFLLERYSQTSFAILKCFLEPLLSSFIVIQINHV